MVLFATMSKKKMEKNGLVPMVQVNMSSTSVAIMVRRQFAGKEEGRERLQGGVSLQTVLH